MARFRAGRITNLTAAITADTAIASLPDVPITPASVGDIKKPVTNVGIQKLLTCSIRRAVNPKPWTISEVAVDGRKTKFN